MTCHSYYNILNVTQEASYEEIRKSYKALVLISHPDKSQDGLGKFLSVSKAWKILSDPDRRKLYDAQIKLQEIQSFAIAEKVPISDFDEDCGNYFYCCRCQDGYELSVEDIDLLVKYVSCSGCSLTIEIIYGS